MTTLVSIIVVLIVLFSGLFIGALFRLFINEMNSTDRVIVMEMTKNIPIINSYVRKVQYKQIHARALPMYKDIVKSQAEYRAACDEFIIRCQAQSFNMPTVRF
jgi:hypothetical protein